MTTGQEQYVILLPWLFGLSVNHVLSSKLHKIWILPSTASKMILHLFLTPTKGIMKGLKISLPWEKNSPYINPSHLLVVLTLVLKLWGNCLWTKMSLNADITIILPQLNLQLYKNWLKTIKLMENYCIASQFNNWKK